MENFKVWLQFLGKFNGIVVKLSFSPGDLLPVHSIAAGCLSLEVYFSGCWCAQRWLSHWRGTEALKNLTLFELSPIMW